MQCGVRDTEQNRRQVKGRGTQATSGFAEILRQSDDKAAESLLWDRIASLQEFPIKISVSNGLRRVELEGVVPGPKTLGTFGASYLYSIFRGWV